MENTSNEKIRRANMSLNAATVAAIEWRKENPEQWNELIGPALAELVNEIGDLIKAHAKSIEEKLEDQDVEVYSQLISLQLTKGLEKRLDAEVETIGGMLLADGFTKRNIAAFMNTLPGNLKKRYPYMEALADAQDRADETGEDQKVDMDKYGFVRTVHPVPRT